MGPHDKIKYLKFFGFFKNILLKYDLTLVIIEYFFIGFSSKKSRTKLIINVKDNINARNAYLPPGLKNQQTKWVPKINK